MLRTRIAQSHSFREQYKVVERQSTKLQEAIGLRNKFDYKLEDIKKVKRLNLLNEQSAFCLYFIG